LVSTQALADTTDISLNVANFSVPPGPYGNVHIAVSTPGVATITFTADSGFSFGDGSTVGMNVNGPFTVASVTGMNLAGISSGQADGFGHFNLLLDAPNFNPGNRTSLVTIVLDGTWTSAAGVVTANNFGFSVEGHVFASATGFTGFVSNGAVPDGGTTLLLLGSALSGLGLLRRKLS